MTAGASTSTSYRFKEWTASSDAVVFANKKSASTTFTMVAGHLTITAVYEAIPTPTAKVQGVGSGGTSSVKCKVGSPATIKAGTLAGKQFRQWVANGDDIVFADPYSATTTFTMPERNDIVVEALWDDVYYTVTVDGGTASVETALMGTVITITANPPEPGKQGNFTRWTASPSVTFASSSASQTTFTMPAKNVVVTANYAAFTKGSQNAPSLPILASASGTTVTLIEIPGAEYRCGSNAWQDSPVFTGLAPGTRYGFSARMKATDLLKESYSSSTLYLAIPKVGVLLGANATDAEKVAADLTALTVEVITDGSTDTSGAVIKKVTLPTTGVNSSKITWASSDPERLNPANGAVSRPAYGDEDARVTLTAKVTCGSATETITLTLTIKALDTPAVLTGVAVTPTTSEIQVGDTLLLTAGPLPAEASLPSDVTWRVSSGSSYASVDENGLVTGLKAGTAKVRATAGGFTSSTVTVKVTDKPEEPDLPELKSVRISPATARIPLNGKKSFTVLGNTGAEAALKESDIAWTIENAEPAEVLTIDGASGTEKVTVQASESVTGKATLRVAVTAKNGTTFTAECEVAVYPVITGLSLDKTALRLMPASTTDLVAALTPATAEAKLHWASSNPQVVAVRPAADGNTATLTATGTGTAMVSVSTEGFLARCAVTVRWNAGTLVLDKEYLLLEAGADDAILTATATAADAAYPLGTPTDLAVVDAAGKASSILELTPRDDGSFAVTPKKKGTAFVKFTVPNNPDLIATCRVDVYTVDPRVDFAQRRVHPAAFTLYTRQPDPEWRLPLVLDGDGNPWRLDDASYAFTGNAADADALSRALDIEPHEDGKSLKLVPTDAFRSLAAKKYSKIGIAVTLPENTGGRALIPD
ncbi:Ig-like domain-containing protein, partial [Ruminococcaceae bacterium OttesenSCG-928-D13]|nr:Ig-like domain-containing protein [Ruminococcaceae bacterium OttesenSCG-928-D13]